MFTVVYAKKHMLGDEAVSHKVLKHCVVTHVMCMCIVLWICVICEVHANCEVFVTEPN